MLAGAAYKVTLINTEGITWVYTLIIVVASYRRHDRDIHYVQLRFDYNVTICCVNHSIRFAKLALIEEVTIFPGGFIHKKES